MKTVQNLLNEVSEHELVDTYFAEFPIDYEMIPAKEITLRAYPKIKASEV